MASLSPKTERIISLDQFRGYTVAGMFLVNFAASFAASPMLLKHYNNFCSYADTIMPQFFFAVGFAFRLTFGRRVQADGAMRAYRHALQRIFGLALVAMVIYTVPDIAKSWEELVSLGPWGALRSAMRDWFQTLMHIAVTSLWVLPVIRARAATCVAFAVFSAALHVALSNWFYYDWVQTNGIDGGVLGFLAWTLPVITGALACDVVLKARAKRGVALMLGCASLMMLAGWVLSSGTTLYDIPPGGVDPLPTLEWAADPVVPSAQRWQQRPLEWAEPPFVPPPAAEAREENYWMMSQRAATLSYHLFAAGFSLAVYAAFRVVCDFWKVQIGLFRTLGVNALVAYILHGIVQDAVRAFIPHDSPGWYVCSGFLLYFGITYGLLRWLENRHIYIKL